MIPIDALTVDPGAHAPFDTDGLLRVLRPQSIVLGETSARLRGVNVGDSLSFAFGDFDVAGVVPDALVAGAEVVFADGDAAGSTTPRYALVSTHQDRESFERFVRANAGEGVAVRIRSAAETPWLRHGDAVLPQVFIKQALGEFAFTLGPDASLLEQAEFVEANIVTVEVPIVGRITCHTTVVEMLIEAMERLEREGLAHLIDPSETAGCWNPRYVSTLKGGATSVSRHAWGAAIDLNAAANPQGTTGTQDRRLVEIMVESGFAWGGEWLVPDPMHFEYAVDH
jgi:hypothetical protein